jgi:hypothetical protein
MGSNGNHLCDELVNERAWCSMVYLFMDRKREADTDVYV